MKTKKDVAVICNYIYISQYFHLSHLIWFLLNSVIRMNQTIEFGRKGQQENHHFLKADEISAH